MKIWNLESENFKKLNVSLAINGKSVTVTGQNEAGKSSFIDALFKSLTGEKIKGSAVKIGEKEARNYIVIRKDNGETIEVEKTYTNGKSELKVTLNGASEILSPQKFLDKTLGDISFDPLEFVRKTPLEQKRSLMNILNIDLDKFEDAKRKALDEVKKVNDTLIRIEGELEELPQLEEEYEFKEDTELMVRLNQIESDRQELSRIKNEIIANESKISFQENVIKENLKKIKELEKANQSMYTAIEDCKKKIEGFEAEKDKFVVVDDSDQIENMIKDIRRNNDAYKIQQERIEKQKLYEQVELDKTKALGEVKKVELERNDYLAGFKMPIEKLEFYDTGLMYDGLPLTEDNVSSSKLIEIGVRISVALHPGLRIMQIKDGSLLDSNTLKAIKEIIKENDYQLFIEKVSDEKELGFIIDEAT